MTIKVLVVDDQALLRTAFASLINAEDDLAVIGNAADGRQAVELASSLAPDVVVHQLTDLPDDPELLETFLGRNQRIRVEGQLGGPWSSGRATRSDRPCWAAAQRPAGNLHPLRASFAVRSAKRPLNGPEMPPHAPRRLHPGAAAASCGGVERVPPAPRRLQLTSR